jgi:5-methylthioadenosine/S-adenosylhomocysteine deaminase
VTDLDYHHWITPREAVEMAALGGAKGLNLSDDMGSLTIGKKADLVLYDLMNLSLLPRTEPIGLLVLGRPVNVVDHAWVNGKMIVKDGEMCNVNVNELKQALSDRSQWSTKRQTSSVAEAEVRYRSVMGLPSIPQGYA